MLYEETVEWAGALNAIFRDDPRVLNRPVSLILIARNIKGVLRAYFLNPNIEGRQNLGRGSNPSVYGFGEEQGES